MNFRQGDNMKIDPLIGQLVDSIDKLNAQLAKLAPCPTCDGSGQELKRYSGDVYPCEHCWGRGWDLEQLEDDGDADQD